MLSASDCPTTAQSRAALLWCTAIAVLLLLAGGQSLAADDGAKAPVASGTSGLSGMVIKMEKTSKACRETWIDDCRPAATRKCKNVVRQDCRMEPSNTCRDKLVNHCRQTPSNVCHYVGGRQQCRVQMKRDCVKRIRQVCDRRLVRKCRPVVRQDCSYVSEKRCRKKRAYACPR